MFPCNECAKLLIQAGIAEVIYHEGKIKHDSDSTASALHDVCFAVNCSQSINKDHGDNNGSKSREKERRDENGETVKNDDAKGDPMYKASLRLLQMAGVKLRHHKLQHSLIIPPPDCKHMVATEVTK
mmetsp:Transcript_1658/g.2403  ORF Transcript_1658/g.2403 Transcript_1658/m.2403 type:complete len:127 (+) Transcript_1658:147-527(+)